MTKQETVDELTSIVHELLAPETGATAQHLHQMCLQLDALLMVAAPADIEALRALRAECLQAMAPMMDGQIASYLHTIDTIEKAVRHTLAQPNATAAHLLENLEVIDSIALGTGDVFAVVRVRLEKLRAEVVARLPS